MNTDEKRIALAKWILETDENALNEIESIYKTQTNIIAYSVSGKPLTKEMYIERIKDAEKRMDEGKYTTHEDLLKEMQSW